MAFFRFTFFLLLFKAITAQTIDPIKVINCNGIYSLQKNKCSEVAKSYNKVQTYNGYDVYSSGGDFLLTTTQLWVEEDSEIIIESFIHQHRDAGMGTIDGIPQKDNFSLVGVQKFRLKKGFNNINIIKGNENLIDLKNKYNSRNEWSWVKARIFFYFTKNVKANFFYINFSGSEEGSMNSELGICDFFKNKNSEFHFIRALDQDSKTFYKFNNCISKKESFFSFVIGYNDSLPELLPKLNLYIKTSNLQVKKKYSIPKDILVSLMFTKADFKSKKFKYEKFTGKKLSIKLNDSADFQKIFTLSELIDFRIFKELMEHENIAMSQRKFYNGEKVDLYKFPFSSRVNLEFQLISVYPGESQEVIVTDFEWRVEP